MNKIIPKTWIPFIALFGAFLYNLNIGIINSYGNLNIYLTSYLRSRGNDVNYKNVSFIYEICVMTLGFSMFFGALIQSKIGMRACILLSSFFAFIAIYLSSIFTYSYVLLCLTMGLMHGFFYGISFTIPLASSYKHFKKNKGLISGIICSAISLNAFYYSSVQTLYINKENIFPTKNESISKELYFYDEDLLNRVPQVIFIHAVTILISCLFGGYLATIKNVENKEILEKKVENNVDLEKNYKKILEEKKEENNQNISNGEIKDEDKNKNIFYRDNQESDKNTDLIISNQKNESLSENKINKEDILENKNPYYNEKCTKDKKLIFIWISISLFSAYINYVTMYWKIIGVNYTLLDDKVITLNGSFINCIANILGRLIWGSIYDRYSVKSTLLLLGFFIFFSCIIFPLVCHIYILYVIVCFFFYFCIGGSMVTFPVLALKIYGEKYFSFNMSIIYTSRIANTIICNVIVHIFYNLLTLKYLSLSFGVTSFISAIIIYVLTK